MAQPPDWVTIRVFLATLECGSITRAADRCAIATSAAAKRLQVLEADCGVALLERTARGARPTPAGEVFARHAHGLRDLAARLAGDLRAFAAGGLGSARLHATASVLAGAALPDALARFAAAHPGIVVELAEATSLAIVQALRDGQADLGLITTEARLPAGLDAHPWRRDRLLLVVPAGHALAARPRIGFAEALDHPLIGVLQASAIALLVDGAAEKLGRRPDYRFRVESTDAARRLVAAGHGLTVMPDGVLRGYEQALGLKGIPLADPWARRRLRLVSRPEAMLPPPARRLRDHLLAGAAG